MNVLQSEKSHVFLSEGSRLIAFCPATDDGATAYCFDRNMGLLKHFTA